MWVPTESRWVQVEHGDPYPRSALAYLDTATLVGDGGGFVQAWVLVGWSEASLIPAPLIRGRESTFDNTRTLTEFDCRNPRTRALRMDGYLGRREVFSTNAQAEWMPVVSMSLADVLMPIVCELANESTDRR